MSNKRVDKASLVAKRIMLAKAIPHLGNWMDRLDELTRSSDDKTAVSAVRTGLNFTKDLMNDDEALDAPELWDELDKLDTPTHGRDSKRQTPIPPVFDDVDNTDPDS